MPANIIRKPIGENPSGLVRERTLARRYDTSIRTLQRWRAKGYGPAHIVIGGGVRYRMVDVLEFETRMRCGGGGGQ